MKQVRFTGSQIISILSQQEKGIPGKDICRENGISDATLRERLSHLITKF